MMSISISFPASACLIPSSHVRLSREFPSTSTENLSKSHLGRFNGRERGRGIVCCSSSEGRQKSAESQGNLSEISGSKDMTEMSIKKSTTSRREMVLKSSSAALLVAFLNFSGTRPDYLGVQKNPPSLALCPPTPNCISTSEELNDPAHYVPPWSYNPADGRARKNPATKEKAMAELIEVVQSTKPDNYTPRIVKATEDYLYVEYECPLPLLKFVDDVEFWFPPGERSIVEYRSASRVGQTDFDANRKRIRALRQALEKKGWESVGY
ncbi:unnamed protein product [Calypogeia fissa]